jgi:hypothetical protein
MGARIKGGASVYREVARIFNSELSAAELEHLKECLRLPNPVSPSSNSSSPTPRSDGLLSHDFERGGPEASAAGSDAACRSQSVIDTESDGDVDREDLENKVQQLRHQVWVF